MNAHDAVHAAATGVRAQVAWQLWSRLAALAVKAAAVRAAGPVHFAYTTIRLGLLSAVSRSVAFGVRKIVVRGVVSDEEASVLTSLAMLATCALAASFGALMAWLDPENAGPIAVIVIGIASMTLMERGRVFCLRRGRHVGLQRARAFSRVVGGLSTAACALLLPRRLAARYALPGGNVIHGLVMFLTFEYVAGAFSIPVLGPRRALQVLRCENMQSAAIAVWQTLFGCLVEKGQALVLDATVDIPDKGAYELVRNFTTMVARFFHDALEEQSFTLLSRLSYVFQPAALAGGDESAGESFPGKEAREVRGICTIYVEMTLKASILVSLFLAVVGPAYSYTIFRVLYGTEWSDRTPAPYLLSWQMTYLVFLSVKGVLGGLIIATGSAAKLKQQSMLSFLLSGLYLCTLVYVGPRHSALGFIAANCADTTFRTMYAAYYYSQVTGRSIFSLVVAVLPHPLVVLMLAVLRAVCMASEAALFASMGVSTSLLRHIVLGFVSVLLFVGSVVFFETSLRSYISRVLKPASSIEEAPT